MIYTRNLPIYRKTYTLVSRLIDCVANFPDAYKLSIGQMLLGSSAKLLKFISMVNRSSDDRLLRNARLDLFLIEFEQVKTYFRICREKHIITTKQAAKFSSLIVAIDKEASIWKLN